MNREAQELSSHIVDEVFASLMESHLAAAATTLEDTEVRAVKEKLFETLSGYVDSLLETGQPEQDEVETPMPKVYLDTRPWWYDPFKVMRFFCKTFGISYVRIVGSKDFHEAFFAYYIKEMLHGG
jgi:hypothetical protein